MVIFKIYKIWLEFVKNVAKAQAQQTNAVIQKLQPRENSIQICRAKRLTV